MQKLSWILALGLSTAGLVLAQERFSEGLTSEQRAVTGLNQLTPGQLKALDALIDARRPLSSNAAVAPVPTATIPANPPTRARVNDAEAPKPVEAEKHRRFGLPVRDESDSITGVLDGEFRGWSGATMFKLQDGQWWVQADATDHYESKRLQNPTVHIGKSMFGGYKMTVDGVPGWVRVRRVQ